MRNRGLTLTTGVMLFLAACSSYTVRFDYDVKADFSAYRTFGFYPVPEEIRSHDDERILHRIRESVVRELQAKGLAPTADAPDLLIAVHTERGEYFNITEWGYHYAPYDAYYRDEDYWSGSGIDARGYEEGTLILDIVRADEDELIWRGAYPEALPQEIDPEKIDEIMNRAVSRILENFPPRGKG